MATVTDLKNTIDGVEYPPFRGSVAQCKWARSIRFKVLHTKIYPREDDTNLLRRIDDATWWIANQDVLFEGRQFKMPASNQMVSAANPQMELPVQRESFPEPQGSPEEEIVKFSVTSARLFAKEISYTPKLAELAVLVIMARGTKHAQLREGLRDEAFSKLLEYENELTDKPALSTIRILLKQLRQP